MGQIPYSSYHGRKRRFRSVLIGVVAALVILLGAVLAGYYLGLFNIPGADLGTPAAPAQPTQAAVPDTEPVVIVDASAPTPTPAPAAAAADLSGLAPKEKLPLGLVTATFEDVSAQAPDKDVLVDMTAVDLSAAAPLPAGDHYVAAWWSVDPADADAASAACTALAALGFDEIVLSSTLPADDGAALAALYRQLKADLDKAGWQGRLGLDVDQGIFASKYDADLVPAVAQTFTRLYFRHTLAAGNKTALTKNGFVATGYTIVTVTKTAANLNYAWAVLP